MEEAIPLLRGGGGARHRIRDGMAQAGRPAGKHERTVLACSVRRPRTPSTTVTACRSWSATLRWGSTTPTSTTIPTRSLPRIARPLAIDPDNLVSLNNLAVQFAAAAAVGRGRKPRHACDARIGRGASFYNNLYQAQVAQGHFADAHATLARYAKASPGSPYVLAGRACWRPRNGTSPTAERLVQQLRKEQSSSPFWRKATTAGAGPDSRAGRQAREAAPVSRRADRRCRSAKLT